MAIEHKPLIEYLPSFLAEYREFQRLFGALWYEISEMDNSILSRIDRGLLDTFISEADLAGIQRWEKMLHIVPNAEETLADRREAVRMTMAGRRPFTLRRLQEILDNLVGEGEYTLTMTDTFQMTIRLALTSKYQYGSVQEMVRKIAPANIQLVMSLLYHQHSDFIGNYTHGQMAAYTHADLREGVIPSE